MIPPLTPTEKNAVYKARLQRQGIQFPDYAAAPSTQSGERLARFVVQFSDDGGKTFQPTGFYGHKAKDLLIVAGRLAKEQKGRRVRIIPRDGSRAVHRVTMKADGTLGTYST